MLQLSNSDQQNLIFNSISTHYFCKDFMVYACFYLSYWHFFRFRNKKQKNVHSKDFFFHFQHQISHKLANPKSQCENKATNHKKNVVVFVFV